MPEIIGKGETEMTNQARMNAYDALDNFLESWVDVAPYAREEFTREKQLVADALDKAVDEAYQCGYRDGHDAYLPGLVEFMKG